MVDGEILLSISPEKRSELWNQCIFPITLDDREPDHVCCELCHTQLRQTTLWRGLCTICYSVFCEQCMWSVGHYRKFCNPIRDFTRYVGREADTCFLCHHPKRKVAECEHCKRKFCLQHDDCDFHLDYLCKQ